MKEKKKFYPVNNQEDEDGYTLPDATKKHRLSPSRNFENTRSRSAKLQTRSLMLSSFQQSLER
jgi:hypothetical protein